MILVANCGEIIPPLKLGHGSHRGMASWTWSWCARMMSGKGCAVWHVLRELPARGSGTFIGYARGRTVQVETIPLSPWSWMAKPAARPPSPPRWFRRLFPWWYQRRRGLIR
jgi:hypothetical protein